MRAGFILLLLPLAAGAAAAELQFTFGGWVVDLQAKPVAGAAVEVRNATTGAVVASTLSDGRGWWQVSQGNLFQTEGWRMEAAATAEGATASLTFATRGAGSIMTGTIVLPIHPPPTPPAPATPAPAPGSGGCCALPPAVARPGEPAVFDLPPGAPVDRVEVVTEEPGEVRLSVKPLAAPPAGTPPLPGPVYRLMEISLTGPGGPVKVKSIAVEFRVERTWLNQNGVPEERVALARLGKGWTLHPAKKVGGTPAEVKFRAELPGLSVLAITAAPAPSPSPPPPSPPPSPAALPPLQGFLLGVPEVLGALGRPLPLLAASLALAGAGLYLWRWAGRRA